MFPTLILQVTKSWAGPGNEATGSEVAQQPVVECDWQLLEWGCGQMSGDYKFAWPMVYLPLPSHIPFHLFGCGYALLAYNVHTQLWGVLTIELLTLSCVTDYSETCLSGHLNKAVTSTLRSAWESPEIWAHSLHTLLFFYSGHLRNA